MVRLYIMSKSKLAVSILLLTLMMFLGVPLIECLMVNETYSIIMIAKSQYELLLLDNYYNTWYFNPHSICVRDFNNMELLLRITMPETDESYQWIEDGCRW